jgi:hypothetical protein
VTTEDPWSTEAQKRYPLIYDLFVNDTPATWWRWLDDGSLEVEVAGEVIVVRDVVFGLRGGA